MDFRNTKPQERPDRLDDGTLIDQLCLALRDLGIDNAQLPDRHPIRELIQRVAALHAEVHRRGLHIGARLHDLSRETGWNMVWLLRDAIGYPQSLPYLEARNEPTCGDCGADIPRSALLGLCAPCVSTGLKKIAEGNDLSHLEACSFCRKPARGRSVYADGLEWMSYCGACLEMQRERYERLTTS